MVSSQPTGKLLNELWDVGAQHALYRSDGKWFHHLRKFPGVLFDANGYLIISTEEEYKNSPYFQLKEHLHVPQGISNIPGYVRVSEQGQLLTFSEILEESTQDETKSKLSDSLERYDILPILKASDLEEAKRITQNIQRVIRDTLLSQYLKVLYNYKCQICNTSIEISKNRNYIEAHHIKPLGSPHNGPDVLENIICVCPNHHAQLDYGAIKLYKDKLTFVIPHEINDEYIDYHNNLIFNDR